MPDSALPDGWLTTPFTNVADVNPQRQLRTGEIAPFVEMASVRERFAGVASVGQRVANGAGAKFRNGDTIFARITPCAENGKVAFVDFLPDGVTGFGSTEFIVFSAREGKADARYVYHLVSSRDLHQRAISQMRGTSGRQRVPDDFFRQGLTVAVPLLSEQTRIAEVLDSIDAAIEKTEAVIEATERLRSALLQELLSRGVPGWHTEWKQVPGIGTIPACWEVVRLEDVADVQTGRQVGKPPSNGATVTMPYLSVANVKDGYLNLQGVKTMDIGQGEALRFALRAGDVLFTEGGDADKLGRGCVWNSEIDPCLHQNHVFAVRPHAAQLSPYFLAHHARSDRGKAYFMSCAKQTTNLASINSTQLKAMPLPLPNVSEQRVIEDALRTIDGRSTSESNRLSLLRAVKRIASGALLSGRVRVAAVRSI